jgi:hypothetical protein
MCLGESPVRPWERTGHRGRAKHLRAAAASLALALSLLFSVSSAQGFGVHLQTGVNIFPLSGEDSELALDRIHSSGARLFKLAVDWYTVAPAKPKSGFNASDPDDPGYRWRTLDGMIAEAVDRGLTPVIDFSKPPGWAETPEGSGWEHPNPVQLAMFAHAFAARYDGTRPGLPRVRYWEAWNEPNVSYFLQPQFENGRPVSVDAYRTIVNDFAAAVHEVHSDNIVVGGELFPNGVQRGGVSAVAPLEFTRRLFCLSSGPQPHRVCDTAIHVDAWSVHPYTSGGPSTLPANPDNVWIYNLSALTSLVHAAQRVGTLISSRQAEVWVSEFSWDTNPPNPKGVPMSVERRWVAETIYRSWQAGINVFIWFTLHDMPNDGPPLRGGLYFNCEAGVKCERPKPIAAAFRFPFVAYRTQGRNVLLWGRTPAGRPGNVRVQWLQEQHWKGFLTLPTDSDGVFTAAVTLPPGANPSYARLRALQPATGASPAFSLHRPPDIKATPFG